MGIYSLVKKRFSALLLVIIVTLSSPLQVFAEGYEQPRTSFEYLGIGSGNEMDRSIENDLFYLEYPSVYTLGTSDYFILALSNSDNTTTTSDNDFHSFQDTQLIGSDEQIANFVNSGGINHYLKQVLKTEITNDYQLSEDGRYDGILYFSLTHGGEDVASIVIWNSLGKISIRSELRTSIVDKTADYGLVEIYSFENSVDFSSIEALKTFAFSSSSPYILDESDQISTFSTTHHDYLCITGEDSNYYMALYFPVTPAGQSKWMVAFNVPKESQIENNSFAIREDMMRTFKVFK